MSYERQRPDGTVLRVDGSPIPGGGYVTTFQLFHGIFQAFGRSDVTLPVAQQCHHTLKYSGVVVDTEEMQAAKVRYSPGARCSFGNGGLTLFRSRGRDGDTEYTAAALHGMDADRMV